MAYNSKNSSAKEFESVIVPPYFEKEKVVATHNEDVGNNISDFGQEYIVCSSSISSSTEELLTDEMIKIEKNLVRRLDFIYAMPCLCLLIMIQYFDKTALNYSAVLGIKEDTHIDDAQFGWLGSIFFIGYLLFQAPNAYLMQKLPLSKYLGILIVVWGTILGFTSVSRNFSHLLVFRFFLGVFEAAVFPCCIIIINRLYRRREQTTRISVFYMAGGISMSAGGIISYGIGHMDGVAGRRAWQWIMIILGCITVAFGIGCYFLLVDDASCIARSDKERAIIRLRMKDNAVVVSQKVNFQQIREAFTEVRFYCFMLFALFLNFQNGAMLTFSSTITKGFGFSNLNAILLGIPNGIVSILFLLIAILVQKKCKNSTLYTACAMTLVASLGLLLLIMIPYVSAKLIGLYLSIAYVSALVLLVGCMSNNVSGYTKKIFYSCALSFSSTLGNVIGPQMIVVSKPPLYIGGMLGYIGANLICTTLLLIARHSMSKLNRERGDNNRPIKENETKHKDDNVDRTDVEDNRFVYML